MYCKCKRFGMCQRLKVKQFVTLTEILPLSGSVSPDALSHPHLCHLSSTGPMSVAGSSLTCHFFLSRGCPAVLPVRTPSSQIWGTCVFFWTKETFNLSDQMSSRRKPVNATAFLVKIFAIIITIIFTIYSSPIITQLTFIFTLLIVALKQISRKPV